MGRMDLQGMAAEVREFGANLLEDLGIIKDELRRLKRPDVQRYRANFNSGSVVANPQATPLADTPTLCRDLELTPDTSNADIMFVGGPNVLWVAGGAANGAVGKPVNAFTSTAYSVPDLPKFAECYYDLSQVYVAGIGTDILHWTAITYTQIESA